jgi:hypothetical protein
MNTEARERLVGPPYHERQIAVAFAEVRQHILAIEISAGFAMRSVLVLALLAPLAAGCVATIPVKDDFGSSALVPAGDIPPEFAGFNNYDPQANRLMAAQTCATPAMPLGEQTMAAEPGQLVQATARCQTHIPLIGSWQETRP